MTAASPTRSFDVVVVGAGSAGCCAAIASAMSGASTLLVERYGFLGGVSTQSLDTFYGFFTPGDRPRKVVGGIPDQVVDRLAGHGEIFLRPNTYGAGTGVTYNPEYLKIVWDELVASSGAQVLLHSLFTGIEKRDSSYRLTLTTPGGLLAVDARRIVDASGDAHVAHALGMPLEDAGTVDAAQTFTTTFRMCNVDLERYRDAGGKTMLQQKMNDAVVSGRHPLPRRKGSIHAMVQPNCIATVAVRVPFASPFDPDALTRAEMEGRRQAYVYETFLRAEVPGFEDSKIIGMSSPQIGIRESRRLYGAYRLTRDDCLRQARFEDAVLLCGAPIEDHRMNADGEEETEWCYVPDGGVYEVPYRTLYAPGFDRILVAGRCFSADHSAHASCRSMGQTMSMGQGAGVAAALSLEKDCAVGALDAVKLQARLRDLGAVIEPPDTVAATGKDDWFRNR
ncbi:MAG: FAD-dependent oxidoreductase [Rhizobiaceae bacterium]|nr:FAD-dependent oxidoreductase [Rhizobiaceae bacterium]